MNQPIETLGSRQAAAPGTAGPARPGGPAALEAAADLPDLPDAAREAAYHLRQFLSDRGLSEAAYLIPPGLLDSPQDDRPLVKQWSAAFRALPPAKQLALADVLNRLARVEWAVGEFQSAQRDFQILADQSTTPEQQAQAYYHAYLAALERPNLTDALRNLHAAIAIAPQLAPVPVEQFQVERILAADAHGLTLRCVLTGSDGLVVVRTLDQATMDRPLAQLFQELTAVTKLDHPALARSGGYGFLDEDKSRGYVVTEFNDGQSLDEFVDRHSTLRSKDLIAVAAALAEALMELHDQGLFHTGLRPANILIKKSDTYWRVVLGDFGVRLPAARLALQSRNPALLGRTRHGRTVAQHLDYLPPEAQPGADAEASNPAAGDVYSLAKCCCLALFGNPHPATNQWARVPETLAELLNECLAQDPRDRPSMKQVCQRLQALQTPTNTPAAAGAPAAPLTAALPAGVGQATAPVLPSGMPERRRLTPEDLRGVLLRRRITWGVLIGLVVGFVGMVAWVFLVRDPVNTIPTLVAARGKVVFEGKPVAGAKVTFHPVLPNVPRASATTAEDGTFTLTTFMKHDGAYPGRYTVTIEKFGDDPRAVPNLPRTDPRVADFYQNPVTPLNDVHPNYGMLQRTPLRNVVVPDRGTSDIVLRLNILGR